MKFLVMLFVILLFGQGILSAGELNPVQKTTVYNEPTQKNTPTTIMEEPTQKTIVYNEPTQKTTTPFSTPTQKGTGTAMSDVPIPDELLDELKRLQPQECEPLRNLGRCIARRVVKRKISDFVQDNLPSSPPLPLP